MATGALASTRIRVLCEYFPQQFEGRCPHIYKHQTNKCSVLSVYHGNCPKLPQNTARVPNGMRGFRDRLLSF